LEKDPQETTDLAAQYPDRVAQLEGYMDAAHQESTVFPFKPL